MPDLPQWPTTAGGVAAPIQLTAAAPAVALESSLANGDANPAFQVNGNGELQWGPGGAAALDTILERNGVALLEVGDGVHDIVLGESATSAYLGTSPNTTLVVRSAGPGNYINLNAGGDLLLNPNGLVQLQNTMRNAVAGNETAAATAGTNGAPPAQVKGYLVAQDHTGTVIKIPYYAA